MINELSISLGVEEFAVVMSLLKKTEEAKGLLISVFGAISPEEEKGRVSAAYNSLFARGLLTYEQKDVRLHPDVKNLLDIFFDSHKLIKVGKAIHSGEEVVSFYAHRDVWLEHTIAQGVAHHFKYPVAGKTIQKYINDFLLVHSSSTHISTCVNIPANLILNSPPGTLSDYDAVLTLLKKNTSNKIPEMEQLADDIANGEWRGSTIWMDRPDDEQLLTRGYLWVQGKDRLWAINSGDSNESNLLATLYSKDDFDSKILSLVSAKP